MQWQSFRKRSLLFRYDRCSSILYLKRSRLLGRSNSNTKSNSLASVPSIYCIEVFRNVMNRKFIDETIGWYGTCAIVVSYALSSFGYLLASTFLYRFLNLTGALGIMYISFKKKTYQPGVLNIIWAIIALIAIFRLL